MGVLDTILRYKQQKDAEATADISAIPQAAMLYQQAKQQQFDNQIKSLTAQAQIAKAGYKIGPNGKLVRDESLAGQNPVFTVDDQGQLVQAGSIPKGGIVKQLPQSVDTVKQKAEASRQATVNNPMVNQDTQGAVAAYQYIQPRLDKIRSLVGSGALSGDTFTKLAKQVTVGKSGELVVPDGSPLESLIGDLNDIKLTGFGLGGKNFTENEAKIIFGRLDPTGKSDARFLKDLNSLQEFFKLKAEAGTRGLSDTKDIINSGESKSSQSQDMVTISNGKETRTVTREEAKKLGAI